MSLMSCTTIIAKLLMSLMSGTTIIAQVYVFNKYKITIKHEHPCKILYVANSRDPDEMHLKYHLPLHCLSKYLK